MKYLLFLTLTSICLTHAVRVVTVQTKTNSDRQADMDDPSGIDITMYNSDGLSCFKQNLDNGDNVFEEGAIDTFTGPETTGIGSCYYFDLPDSAMPRFRVQHYGGDAWLYDWIHIILEDGTILNCGEGRWLDNSEYFETPCLEI